MEWVYLFVSVASALLAAHYGPKLVMWWRGVQQERDELVRWRQAYYTYRRHLGDFPQASNVLDCMWNRVNLLPGQQASLSELRAQLARLQQEADATAVRVARTRKLKKMQPEPSATRPQ